MTLSVPAEIGAHQPLNEFKEIIILPYFSSLVKHVCSLDDEKRFITGDDGGNLWVWDVEVNPSLMFLFSLFFIAFVVFSNYPKKKTGSLLKRLELHQTAINGLIKIKMSHQFTNMCFMNNDESIQLASSASESNLIVVSSIDKTLSVSSWLIY